MCFEVRSGPRRRPLGWAEGKPEPADRLQDGANAAFRSVRQPGRPTGPAERCGGRPVGFGAPASLLAHPVRSAGVVLCVCCRCFCRLSFCVAQSLMAAAGGFVGSLAASAGRWTSGRRLRAAAGRTGREVPAGPGEAGLAAAGGSDRLCGLRPLGWRRKAVPGDRDAGQAGGTAEVPVRADAGRLRMHSRPAGWYRPQRRRRLAVRRQVRGLGWRFLGWRRRNWCAAIPLHHAGHGRCVCASVGSC